MSQSQTDAEENRIDPKIRTAVQDVFGSHAVSMRPHRKAVDGSAVVTVDGPLGRVERNELKNRDIEIGRIHPVESGAMEIPLRPD